MIAHHCNKGRTISKHQLRLDSEGGADHVANAAGRRYAYGDAFDPPRDRNKECADLLAAKNSSMIDAN